MSRWVSFGLCALAATAIFAIVCTPEIVGTASGERKLPVYSVEREGKYISLTFDAAWGNEDTQQLIDILAEYDVKATFFVVGEWVDKYPESVKALHDAGHEVMNHSDSHPHMSELSAEELASEIRSCNARIESITGTAPTLFRCPYGEYDDHVIGAVNSLGMTAIQWSTDSLDWKGLTAREICDRIERKASPGDIVLFHNAADHTPEALPEIIAFLRQEGYTIVPVSQLLLSEGSYIDHTGRQKMAEAT